MSSKELIMDAVDKAYHGLPVEYHKRLGERLVACVANWVDEDKTHDVICDIQYHKKQVTEIYHSTIPPISP